MVLQGYGDVAGVTGLTLIVGRVVTFGIYADFESRSTFDRLLASAKDSGGAWRPRDTCGSTRLPDRARHRPVQQRQWERNVVWRRTIGRVLRGLERQSRLTLALLSRVNPNFRFWPVAVVLVGCCENSQEEAELEAIADAMDAYDPMARLAPLLI